MKKIITFSTILFTTLAAHAEQADPPFEPFKDRGFIFDMLNIIAIVTVIYMISNFILQILRQNIDYRLKNRILDKGTPENIVTQLVKVDKKEPGQAALQWFFVLGGIALGFTILHFIGSFGLHSLAIMAFCIAVGFAGSYYFTRQPR